LEIHYNKADNTAVCRITLSGETLPALQQTTQESGVVIPLQEANGQKAWHQDRLEREGRGAQRLVPLFPSVACTHQILEGHTGAVLGVALGAVDGRPVALSGSDDHTVRLWNLRSKASIAIELGAEVHAIALDRGTSIVVATEMGMVAIEISSQLLASIP
jgi:hypothetical protein